MTQTDTQRGVAHASGRISFAAMSIPLGLAGTGAAWTAAARRFDLTPVVGEVLFAVSAGIWLVAVIARAPVTRTRWRELREELRHPVVGPFPAYVPIIALLLTAHYAPYLAFGLAQVLAIVWVGLLTLMCGNLIAFWLSGTVRLHHVHPGYSLPVIAGPYIAASTLAAVGFDNAALAGIGAGTFFWLAIGTVIIGRLIIAQPLHPAMAPTLSVLVTPPVTAGLAWFAHTRGQIDTLQHLLLGVIVLLLAAQLFLVATYVRVPFGIAWWAFSFPAGALAGYSIRWDAAAHTPTSTVIAVIALTIATLTVATLSAASIGRAGRRRLAQRALTTGARRPH